MEKYDRIIIGAGLYGLYAALFCCKRDLSVLVIECESEAFLRATYINQARVHQGYHYPRSLATAIKSAGYFDRFNKDYNFCINKEYDSIYATSSTFSWTDRKQFMDFCKAAAVPCEEVNVSKYFKNGMCDGAFLTREYTYDAKILRDFYLNKLSEYANFHITYNTKISKIEKNQDYYAIVTNENEEYRSSYVLSATYAGSNQILDMAGFEKLGIKYELCEIILCNPGANIQGLGFTIMDGPFFSLMPFGKTGYHSLTSVTFTPHKVCYDELPSFECQNKSNNTCSSKYLANCNLCQCKPDTAFPYMAGLAQKYLKDEYDFEYSGSLFSMKPILKQSEIDDSRPTVVKKYSENPTFISVLSGKINTVYDLDEVL